MEDPDVAIVGGGAAGIAAARRLAAHGLSVLLLEAQERLGGRAHTAVIDGLPLDLGCGWLHSADRNPLVTLADQLGVTVDRSQSAWHKQLRSIGIAAGERHKAWRASDRFDEALRRAPPASDCAADVIAAGDRWRPFLDALSSYLNGVELDDLSAADYLAYDEAATEKNWRLPGGYGSFIAGLGAEIPQSLGTPVGAIRHSDGIVLDTARGSLRAKAAIVTVPTTVLARGGIRFEPTVDDQLHAAASLPLGVDDKIFLSIAEPESVPAESHLLGSFERSATGSYYIRPFGRPIIECFLGGSHALALEQAGETAAFAFVRDELGSLLGAKFARGLAPLAVTRWAHEPWIGGAYSHALPGHAAARAILARPASERLIFAGEACSPRDFSTAHGAWESGIAAADRIADALG